MRWFWIAALTLVTACGGCGGNAPQPIVRSDAKPIEVLRDFYAALAEGDFDRAEGLVLVPSSATIEAMRSDFGTIHDWMLAGRIAIEPKEEKVGGDWAVVITRHALETEGVTEVRVEAEFLVRRDEGWRLVAGKPIDRVREDPAIQPLWSDYAETMLEWYRVNHLQLVAKYGGPAASAPPASAQD